MSASGYRSNSIKLLILSIAFLYWNCCVHSPRRRTTIVLDFIILVLSVNLKSGFGIRLALFNVLPINEYSTVITVNGMMKKATVDMIIKFSQTLLGALKGSPHQAESGRRVSSLCGCGLEEHHGPKCF